MLGLTEATWQDMREQQEEQKQQQSSPHNIKQSTLPDFLD